MNKSQIIKNDDSEFKVKIKNINNVKNNCTETKTYCFVDQDCLQSCYNSSMYSCLNGVCKKSLINTTDAENECDPSKGIVGYLVGNPTFGTYQYICKSIDPGIAISVDENLMCKNDPTVDINYIEKFPSKYDCSCENQVLIPATSVKRKHVECDDNFYDLVKY